MDENHNKGLSLKDPEYGAVEIPLYSSSFICTGKYAGDVRKPATSTTNILLLRVVFDALHVINLNVI